MITVVLPAYNEADSIGLLLSRIDELMEKKHYPIRVIVVDDGSQDSTAQNARTAMPEAVVISHEFN